MKTIRTSGTRGLILAAALGVSVGVGFASPAFAQAVAIVNPDGKVTRLGTLGGFYSVPSDINESGQVVGFSAVRLDLFEHAFIAGPDGMGMRDLGTLNESNRFSSSIALGINDAGQVVGNTATTTPGRSHAFITGPDGMG
ncbi:MAG: HAF repeat-containing protein, partial [Nitrosospira sp.]